MTTAFRQAISDIVARIDREGIVGRLWARDFTLFGASPQEISDRFGWLDLPRSMLAHRAYLEDLARDVLATDPSHVVLFGMGGSSLAPEVFARTFGSAPGHPLLLVLDSTVPAAVRAVRSAIDIERTFFVVSSKSGTTAEPLAFMEYFWREAESAGLEPAGRFAALTDPGTPLGKLAQERGFWRVIENPPDIGGRFAALSLVGLVPAALIGVDVASLLESAGFMSEACGPAVPASENPAVALGAAMAAGAQSGRDKLTVVISEPLEAFGLWLEQLVAESLGKHGTGVVPIVGESLLEAETYGTDRLFVQVRLAGDEGNVEADVLLDRLGTLGHPVISIEVDDAYDLGAQFILWELATALAGAAMGVQPFDQPDVEEAKVEARKALDAFVAGGAPPNVSEVGSLGGLLSSKGETDYLAIMAFVDETDETDQAFRELRAAVAAKHKIATTLGYGPRFLHSTGQLIKGGPANVLCLQIVAEADELEVPGAGYGFGVLADAQAAGDLAALEAKGRRVARIRVSGSVASSIRALAGEVAG